MINSNAVILAIVIGVAIQVFAELVIYGVFGWKRWR